MGNVKIIIVNDTVYKRTKRQGLLEVTTEIIVRNGREITIENGILISSKQLKSVAEEKVHIEEIDPEQLYYSDILNDIAENGNSKQFRTKKSVSNFLGLKMIQVK